MRSLILRGTVAAGATLALLIPAVAASAASPPALGWSPTTSAGIFSYGTVAPGAATPQTFTLKNSGASASAALTVTVKGSAAFTKAADSCTGTSLGPGKSCTVTVTYRPAGPGQADHATLTATSPKPATATPSLTLTGTEAKATPAIATAQQPASAIVGTAVADKATVSGGSSPTGTVTFTLYNNSGCTGPVLFTDTETLSGGTATSAGYTAAATGTDYWTATYNGDANNNAVTSGCADEPVTITGTVDITFSPGEFTGSEFGANFYTYDYGVLSPGPGSTVTFTVKNTGTATSPVFHLNCNFTHTPTCGATDPGFSFSLANNTCTGALGPGGTCTFDATVTALNTCSEGASFLENVAIEDLAFNNVASLDLTALCL